MHNWNLDLHVKGSRKLLWTRWNLHHMDRSQSNFTFQILNSWAVLQISSSPLVCNSLHRPSTDVQLKLFCAILHILNKLWAEKDDIFCKNSKNDVILYCILTLKYSQKVLSVSTSNLDHIVCIQLNNMLMYGTCVNPSTTKKTFSSTWRTRFQT